MAIPHLSPPVWNNSASDLQAFASHPRIRAYPRKSGRTCAGIWIYFFHLPAWTPPCHDSTDSKTERLSLLWLCIFERFAIFGRDAHVDAFQKGHTTGQVPATAWSRDGRGRSHLDNSVQRGPSGCIAAGVDAGWRFSRPTAGREEHEHEREVYMLPSRLVVIHFISSTLW